jgi:hypothetical protein
MVVSGVGVIRLNLLFPVAYDCEKAMPGLKTVIICVNRTKRRSKSVIRLSGETPRTARQLRTQMLLTSEFSMAFRFTQKRHLLVQTGVTADIGQCSGMATSPVISLQPPRR